MKNKNVNISVIVISGDRKIDEMMHMLDVFEPFKAVAVVETLVVTRVKKPNKKETVKMLGAIKKGYEKIGRNVVAVFCPNEKAGTYRDLNIKVISDGQKWVMLDEVLKAYGYQGV